MPNRSHRVALVAHCHLNTNVKVHGLAFEPALQTSLLERLAREETGIIQLPCPETAFLGLRRWGMTYEQYDTPAYRRHCRALLAPVIDTVIALAHDGCELVGVWGADGSPSCGVFETCTGYAGGEIEAACAAPDGVSETRTPGRGVFMEELAALLGDAGISSEWHGINER